MKAGKRLELYREVDYMSSDFKRLKSEERIAFDYKQKLYESLKVAREEYKTVSEKKRVLASKLEKAKNELEQERRRLQRNTNQYRKLWQEANDSGNKKRKEIKRLHREIKVLNDKINECLDRATCASGTDHDKLVKEEEAFKERKSSLYSKINELHKDISEQYNYIATISKPDNSKYREKKRAYSELNREYKALSDEYEQKKAILDDLQKKFNIAHEDHLKKREAFKAEQSKTSKKP